jgi:hypothetical protein
MHLGNSWRKGEGELSQKPKMLLDSSAFEGIPPKHHKPTRSRPIEIEGKLGIETSSQKSITKIIKAKRKMYCKTNIPMT